MNWKKVGLFSILLVLIILIVVFVNFMFQILLLFSLIFIIISGILLYLVISQYTKRRIIYLLLLIFSYIIILTVPFPPCSMGFGKYTEDSFESGIYDKQQSCECIGFELKNVHSAPIYSRCIGFPINYKIHEYKDYLRPIVSAENPLEMNNEVKVSKVKNSKQTVYVFNKLNQNIYVELKLVECVVSIDGKELDTSAIDFIAPKINIEPNKQQEFEVLFKATNNLNKGTYICTIGAFDTNINAVYQEEQFFLDVVD